MYIAEKMILESNDVARNLQSVMLQKAGNIFLWVVLVIPILNGLQDEVLPTGSLLAELENLPTDLHKLFKDVLFAAARGHLELLKLLLDSGADIHTQCEDHSNALQAARANGHAEIVRLLEGKEFVIVQTPSTRSSSSGESEWTFVDDHLG